MHPIYTAIQKFDVRKIYISKDTLNRHMVLQTNSILNILFF